MKTIKWICARVGDMTGVHPDFVMIIGCGALTIVACDLLAAAKVLGWF